MENKLVEGEFMGDVKTADYFLVDSKILPKTYIKVAETKRVLEANPETSVNEAVKQIGISRSAFYKYKDHIRPFYETSRGKVLTLLFVVEDFSGILSKIIIEIARANANILTINQNIPINGLADVTICIETDAMLCGAAELMEKISLVNGVKKGEIIAR